MSALGSALLPLLVMLFQAAQGESVDSVALAGAITTVVQFAAQYVAGAYKKTIAAVLAAPVAVVVSGLAAYYLNTPYDAAALQAAVSSVVAIAFAAVFPNVFDSRAADHDLTSGR